MVKRYLVFVVSVAMSVALLMTLGSTSAHAEVVNLDTPTSFTGTIQDVPADTYDVYVRLAQRGQTAPVTVGVQQGQYEYVTVGSLVATSNSWQKLGIWQTSQAEGQASFRLSSDQLRNVVNADRPMLMLISHSSPVCTPNPQCTVTIDGRAGVLLPPGNSALRDTLHISRAILPGNDTVSRVTYYLDNEPIYTTKTYQPFDLRYVLNDEQKAISVIEYASGQRVMIDETIPGGHTDTFWNFLFRGFHRNARLYTSLLVVIGIVALSIMALGILRLLERRRAWRIAHGFIVVKRRAASEVALRLDRIITALRTWLKRLLAGCLIVLAMYGLLAATNTYVVTITRVDGVSMEDTYADSSALLVNKVPVTIAQLAGRNYVPARGQAVILHAVYGIADSRTSSEDGQEYIVKRVLGLPGERVVVDDGAITVYAPDGTVIRPDENAAWSRTMHRATDKERVDVTLGNDEVFVSGDNRPLSMDSRINGPISTSQITGIVVTKVW